MKKQNPTRQQPATSGEKKTTPSTPENKKGEQQEPHVSTDSRKKENHRNKQLGDENEINDDTTI
ncbi:MAG TPA: hypothetical protein VIN08_24990 [Ohtaekwangia sp.]